MNKYRQVQLGNSRLVYHLQRIGEVDLNKAAGLVDLFLDNSRQVELVEEKLYAYPRGEDCWIGKEVAGWPTELPEGLFMKDFRASGVYEMALNSDPVDFQALLKDAEELAPSGARLYRVVFDLEKIDAPILHFEQGSRHNG